MNRKKSPASRETSQTATVRLPIALVNRIDVWAGENDLQARADAVCKLIELALAPAQAQGEGKQRSRAAVLAGRQIDRMSDPSLPREEQLVRKQRLTEGPTPFREVRRDRTGRPQRKPHGK